MQPCSREMKGGLNMNSRRNPSQISLQDLHASHFDTISAAQGDQDFLEQMFSSISPTTSSWPNLNPTNLYTNTDTNGDTAFDHFEESALLASKMSQHQISSSSSGSPLAADAKVMLLQQQTMMMAGGFDPSQGDVQGGDDSFQTLFHGFDGSLPPSQHFPLPQGGSQSFVSPAQVAKSSPSGSGATTASVANGQLRQRVRARRGQATDPHSIAERLRRERIAERLKALQELVPNANKIDKASMLDEIIDYVKFLQLQVKVLSMSRLGGASSVAPLVADTSSENEHQVAKLMEEDMSTAMQYLQGKGLCLMPIALANQISNHNSHGING